MTQPKYGSFGWFDLTVEDAESIRDFYAEVVGWTSEDVSMGDYADFNMLDEEGNPAAGICHARGSNAGLPAQWLMYVNIRDLDASLAAVEKGGGAVVSGPKSMAGYGRYAVIRDPAGSVMTLFEPVATD